MIVTASSRAGFTLLEMLVCLALLALAGSLASTLLRPHSSHLKLESATRGLCDTMRATRAHAMAADTPSSIIFNLIENTYISPVAGKTILPKDMILEFTIARTESRPGAAAIKFFPDGGATGADIRMTLNDRHALISVNWITGLATCALQAPLTAASP